MASRLLSQGLKVVLADIDQANLDRASQVLLQNGVPQSSFLAFNTDVTNQDSCKQLADRAFEFGGGSVDVLHLNAGVADRSKAKAWENASDSFDKVFQVNFGGVLHGARAFVGRMIENRTKPGLVIVTGSKQGITMPPATGAAYNTSKAMVKAYTEMLDYELRTLPSSQMRAALMVPGWYAFFRLGILRDEQVAYGHGHHRVFTKLTSGGKSAEPNAEKPAGAWTPEQTVDYTLDKLDKGSFYIICVSPTTSQHARIVPMHGSNGSSF